MSTKHDRSLSAEFNPDQPAAKKNRPDLDSPPATPPRRTTQKRQVVDSGSEDKDNLQRSGPPAPYPTLVEPGRPSHKQRGVRTDDAPPASLDGLIPPQTPPPKKARSKSKSKSKSTSKSNLNDQFSPQTSRLVAFATRQPIHLLQNSPGSSRHSKPPPKPGQSSRTRVGLNKIAHPSDKGWKNAGNWNTDKTYQKFEEWRNDFSPYKYKTLEQVKMTYLGNPCDHAQDICARPFLLSWNTPDRNPPPELVTKKKVPVMRVILRRTGHCRHGSSGHSDDLGSDADADADGETDDSASGTDADSNVFDDLDEKGYVDIDEFSNSDDDSDNDEDEVEEGPKDPNELTITEINTALNEGATAKTGKRRAPRFKCKVIIHAEVYSNDLNKIHFFQRFEHPPALPQYLDMSHYIRQWLPRLFVEDAEHPTPSYRRPSTTQVNNMVNNVRRAERTLSDPLLSIGIFAELNPDKIFYYSPPDYTMDPPRGFATGIHHPYGTQATLLWSRKHGVGHDSTCRNMNENRAPLTVIITLDAEGHMVPGFAYLSSDISTETQQGFLQETKCLVEKMASDLVSGRVPVAAGLEQYTAELMAEAHYVVKHGWLFPGVIIRICQFHVMQAILRWERDSGPPGEHQPRPTLSLLRKHQLLYAVREIQRCRSADRWSAYLVQFRQRLDTITEGSSTSSDSLWANFDANWFSDEWRDHWTDMGLPAGQNHDGMLSTNNWTERAFKTFNQVFLGNRTNKS
ncbi:hypothetical protein B0H10DRAFT_2215280 [Mycena sp. CBHHK59/15]|nr:hypothetical protein B0H10DRAFT_2215280 [Mycena sp. CBHHK59/15]